jgi:hypothetical protein
MQDVNEQRQVEQRRKTKEGADEVGWSSRSCSFLRVDTQGRVERRHKAREAVLAKGTGSDYVPFSLDGESKKDEENEQFRRPKLTAERALLQMNDETLERRWEDREREDTGLTKKGRNDGR